MKTPKWMTRISLAAFLFGLATIVILPPVMGTIISAIVDGELPPGGQLDEEARKEFRKQRTVELLEPWAWLVPVGGALGFGGMIGLILTWVSRPLGDDLDEPDTAAPPSG